MQKIPVIINSRNRVSCLKLMVDWLRKDPMADIIILDNKSTYEPLLDYYKTLDCQIEYLGKNCGHHALYTWNKHHDLNSRYFIYSDPDMIPKEDCPKDLIPHLLSIKKEHLLFNKVGAMLETTDLPDHYKFKHDVIELHSNYCHNRLKNSFVAYVDTTFALYDIERTAGSKPYIRNCLITDRPYVMRHLPWYEDSNNLTEESVYYASTADAVFVDTNSRIKKVGLWTQKTRTMLEQPDGSPSYR